MTSEPPQTITCPNCGASRPKDIPFCSNCGFTGVPVKKKPVLLWVLLFAFIGAPAGCLGGCFLLMSGGGMSNNLGGLGIGILGLVIFVSFLWMLIRSGK